MPLFKDFTYLNPELGTFMKDNLYLYNCPLSLLGRISLKGQCIDLTHTQSHGITPVYLATLPKYHTKSLKVT